ncbi:hypothetical protein D9M69_698800 [compost metagenome]
MREICAELSQVLDQVAVAAQLALAHFVMCMNQGSAHCGEAAQDGLAVLAGPLLQGLQLLNLGSSRFPLLDHDADELVHVGQQPFPLRAHG